MNNNPESDEPIEPSKPVKPSRKSTPPAKAKADEAEDIHLNLTVTPGEPISFEVPEGVQRVTLNFDPSFLGQPLPSAERRPGVFGSLAQGCGSLLLTCFTVLVILGIIGMLFGK